LKSFINYFFLLKVEKRGRMRSVLKRKKGAIELSMTTVVVIVLAMTMLALGLTLVRTLFKGAIWTAESLSESVHKEVDKMFSEEGTDLMLIGPASRDLGICPGTRPYLHYYLATQEGGRIRLGVEKTEPIGCRGLDENIIIRLSVPAEKEYGPNEIIKTDTVLFNVPDQIPLGCEFYITISATWPSGISTENSMRVHIKEKGILGCTSD
jgi:hypothetical protein